MAYKKQKSIAQLRKEIENVKKKRMEEEERKKLERELVMLKRRATRIGKTVNSPVVRKTWSGFVNAMNRASRNMDI